MSEPSAAPARPRRTRLILAALAVFTVFALAALGTWQVQRLFWKRDLIARIDARIHAEPAAPPAKAQWAGINARDDEYRRLRLEGVFDNSRETLVYASTELGPGAWVVTPLAQADGTTILVNRGFVPGEKRDPESRAAGQPQGPVTVTGLMRMDEPGGTLLQANRPDENRWYSRDTRAIAAARGLADVAPYFVDADATPKSGGWPVGGLTRVALPNSHLMYAVTWYAMAIGLAAALVQIFRRRW